MLHFFRKHQKYFFLFTTIIIVTSFAFFGSYQAFAPSPGGKKGSDPVVFHSVDGKPVKQAYLEHMSLFLSREDWMQSAKIFDSNYLNDGIVSKDILEGGLSPMLFAHFKDHYLEELERRQAKEQNYRPYLHPYIPSLSAATVWGLFAPEIPEKLAAFQQCEDPIASFDARVELFLAERNFPPAFLTQVLRYQERDQPRAPADPRLMKDVISLFGYHDLNDWFGENFVQSVAEVVINTAALARQKGYSVSEAELRSELLYKSEKTFQAISANIDIPVESGQEFFQVYLRSKGLDEVTALRIWEDISLCRRMMQDVGSAALVDALPLEQFYSFANEHATIDLYQMAPELRFKSDEESQIFTAYLEAVAPNFSGYEIPTEYASVETVEARAPQLVGKRYRIYVGAIEKQALGAKVSVKETWDWELANWDALKRAFPELSFQAGTPFEILEKMENRKKIDAYARAKIVESHPEWIEDSVKQASMRETELFVSASGEGELLPGITDRVAFQKMLDTEEEVVGFTQDKKHYYRILVYERSDTKEILSFKEAKGLLNPSSDTSAVSFASYLEKYRDTPEKGLFGIEKKEVVVTRAKPGVVSLDEALALEKEIYSSVAVDENEGTYCFRLKEVLVDTTIPMQKWMEAQELLAKEMRAQFFENVLGQLCSKNSSL